MITNIYDLSKNNKKDMINIFSIFLCIIGIIVAIYNLELLQFDIFIIALVLNCYNKKDEISINHKKILKDIIVKDTNNKLYIIKIKPNKLISFMIIICIIMMLILEESTFFYLFFYLGLFLTNIDELIIGKKKIKLSKNTELLYQMITENKLKNNVYQIINTSSSITGIYTIKCINLSDKNKITENLFKVSPNYNKYDELIEELELLKENFDIPGKE